MESQHQAVTVLEQQLTQMRETLKLVNNEKDEANRQYQNYVRQLDSQQAKLLNEVHKKIYIYIILVIEKKYNCKILY